MRKSKHKDIIKDYDKIKSKHLDKLANRILKDDEKKEELKKYKLSKKFLDIFK
tara:strand:+ start:486 stop:644 length:159 start_codon:yes stop_codon:yes gene_type:complete